MKVQWQVKTLNDEIPSNTQQKVILMMGADSMHRVSIGALFAVGFSVSAGSLLCATAAAEQQSKEVAVKTELERTVWAEQGWLDKERHRWHYYSAGQALAPLSWLQSLKKPDGGKLLDKEYLTGIGFLFDEASEFNKYGLPIGFAVAARSSSVSGFVGMSCSACHTGEVRFNGVTFRIDGGSSNADLSAFIGAYYASLELTYQDPEKWRAFAKSVALIDGTRGENLQENVKRVLDDLHWSTKALAAAPGKIILAGPGRADALNRIGNFLLGELLEVASNFHNGGAPASYPPLWDIWKYNWVHYNASFSQPMARNILQVLGNSGHTNFIDANGQMVPDPERWKTSIDFKAAAALEAGFRSLSAPKWPEHIVGKVDRNLANAGKSLYEKNCSACHAPKPIVGPGNNKAMLAVVTLSVEDIGTDPVHAELFAHRTYDLSKFTGVSERQSGADGLTLLTNKVKAFGYHQLGANAAERYEMDGFGRDNLVRGLAVYKARTLDGIWSTGPFLHNGSVPNIYELLSPVEERSKRFWVGGYEFDPVKLGFVSRKTTNNKFEIDTSLPGNRNTGHEFADDKRPGVIGRMLSHEERMAIIEYLKVLPEMPPEPLAAVDYDRSMLPLKP